MAEKVTKEGSGDNMSDFLPGFPNLDSFNQESLKAIAMATKASNSIPSDRKEDWDYYTTFKSFRQVSGAQSESIRSNIVHILRHNGIKCQVPKSGGNPSDILDMLSDANDQILERINTNLDEASGLKRDIDPVLIEVSSTSIVLNQPKISGSWNKSTKSATANPDPVKLLTGKNIGRPQLAFKDLISNSMKTAFIPRLTEKPHSLKPLSILVEYSADGEEVYSHPYVFEMDNLKFNVRQMAKRPDYETEAKTGTSHLEVWPLVVIDTIEGLKEAIEELKKCAEIAIDLEHHNYRSFQGITSLIQISSITKDYIIDPFPLWQDLTCLNEITANPNIVKIFHGAKNDIMWLQRDFSVYVVNMFDSFVAAQLLDFPRGCRNLAFLLHTYSKVTSDKKFQLADWRIRPLPKEMITYARMDTHYLIDIYHELKTSLIDQSNETLNLIQSVYNQSNDLAKERYQKPHFKPDQTYLDTLRKSHVTYFNARQKFAFREIFNWRNSVARQEDESEFYVLPAHMLLKICTELPREMQGILACCNPVPPLVKQNLHLLHEFILKARDQPITIITSTNAASEVTSTAAEPLQQTPIIEDPLKCPLDLSNLTPDEGGSDLSVILDKASMAKQANLVAFKAKASVSALDSDKSKTKVKQLDKVFLTPFERYNLLKPYLTAMNKVDRNNGTKTSDQDRIDSIKEHFDTLTSLTPQEYTAEQPKEPEEAVIESDEADASIDDYDPDPGVVKSLRGAEGGGSKKRKGSQKQGQPKEAKMDVENVDFTQYSSGIKANSKTFDPSQEFKNKFGKKRPFAGGKAKQRYKGQTGKTVTYNKK